MNFLDFQIHSYEDAIRHVRKFLTEDGIETPNHLEGRCAETNEIVDELLAINDANIVTTNSQPYLNDEDEKQMPYCVGFCQQSEYNLLYNNARKHGYWYCFYDCNGNVIAKSGDEEDEMAVTIFKDDDNKWKGYSYMKYPYPPDEVSEGMEMWLPDNIQGLVAFDIAEGPVIRSKHDAMSNGNLFFRRLLDV